MRRIVLRAFACSLIAGAWLSLIFVNTPHAEAGLAFDRSFSIAGLPDNNMGEAIAFFNNHLFISDNSDDIFITDLNGGLVDGTTLVDLTAVDSLRGLEALSSGNILVVDEDANRVVELAPDGSVASGGIDFTAPELDESGRGVLLHTGTNTIFVVEVSTSAPDLETIHEFSQAGALLGSIDVRTVLLEGGFGAVNPSPEGLGFDPFSGHLLLLDDILGHLIELTTTGTFRAKYDLASISGLLVEPEGVTLDSSTGKLYIVNDNPLSRVDVYDFVAIPEPATSVLLIGIALSVSGR